MKVISVNVGLPREIMWKGTAVTTAIFKEPVTGPVAVDKLNLAGDRQADLAVHGGADKAVYGYPAEHYDYWRSQLPEENFSWGKFGENLTTRGLLENTLYIGDVLTIGSAVLQVTQPRMPRYKLNAKFDRDDMISRFLASGRSGFYFSVVESGKISAESQIEIIARDPCSVAVSDIVRLYLRQATDPELLQRATQLSSLPQSWKEYLVTRFAQHS